MPLLAYLAGKTTTIHLGAGMEYLDHGTLTGDVSHPPMARLLSALGPWLAGEHWNHTGNTTTDGTTVLGHDAHYDRMLALARLGILPFFLLACLIVFLWSSRSSNPGLNSRFDIVCWLDCAERELFNPP